MSRTPATAARPRCRPARRALACLLSGSVALAPGCSALSHYRPTQSGLLSDYSGLSKDRFHVNRGLGLQRNLSRNAAPEALGRVDSFLIEPVVWAVDAESRAGRDPSRSVVLAARLDEALRAELGALRPIVETPGPGTARVRAVITDARLSRPVLNAALTAGGVFVAPLPVGPTFFGGAVVEAEVIGPDGLQVAAISCASGGGPLDVVGFYTRSGHAKKAMRRAARELRETLDR